MAATSTDDPTTNLAASDQVENARAEYAALSQYFISLISHRLTLLGFYLAAVGLMAAKWWPLPVPLAILGCVLTLALYIFELRTRILYHHLAKRGIEIEQRYFCRPNTGDEYPFFSRQFTQYLGKKGERFRDEYFATPLKVLGYIPVKWRFISHSLALDILYLSVLLFFFISLFVKLVPCV